MAGPLVIQTNGNPTPPSDKGWIGAAAGMVLGFGPIGALAGYYVGKKFFGEAQEQEELTTNKKIVREPSFWNAKAAEGFVKGTFYGLLAGAALVLGGAAIGLIGSTAALAGSALMILGVGVAVFGGVYGLVKGGDAGKKQMAAEYAEAEQQQLVQQPSVSKQRTAAVEYDTPERTQSHLAEQQARRANAAGMVPQKA